MEFSPTYTLLKKRGLRFSAASHCRINNGSAGLDEQPSLERNSEKPCHLERNWLLIYFFLVRPLSFGKKNFLIWAWLLTRQKLASRCSLPEHIEEATFYLASVPVVEWLATFNQKRKMEQGKGERSCPLFSGNPSRSYRVLRPPPHM